TVWRGGRDPRVLADRERGVVTCPSDLQSNAILTGCGDGACESSLRRLPRRVVLDTRGVGVAHVPGKAIETGFLRDLRLARLLDLFTAPLLRCEGLLALLLFRLGRRAFELQVLLAPGVHERARGFAVVLLVQPRQDNPA